MKDLRNIHVLEATLFAFSHNGSLQTLIMSRDDGCLIKANANDTHGKLKDVLSYLCSGSDRKCETTQMFVGHGFASARAAPRKMEKHLPY